MIAVATEAATVTDVARVHQGIEALDHLVAMAR
jgi:hypothetical protein